MMVLGETKWDEYDKVGRPVFSADGSTVGIVVTRSNRAFLLNGPRPHSILDSNVGTFVELGDPSFSRDGRVWAYRGRMMKIKEKVIREQIVMARGTLEGQEVLFREEMDPLYESVSDPVVSPDGKLVAYAASKGSRKYLVVGGKPTLKFSLIDRISFGPDGRTLAYRAGQYGKEFIIAGNSRSEEFDQVLSGPLWSADGKKVAFTVRNGAELWRKVLEVK